MFGVMMACLDGGRGSDVKKYLLKGVFVLRVISWILHEVLFGEGGRRLFFYV